MKSGQILVLRAQSVEHPRTERRISKARISSLHQQLRRRVIELIGAHRLDEANVVEVLLQMRQAIGDPVTALVRPDETDIAIPAASEHR